MHDLNKACEIVLIETAKFETFCNFFFVYVSQKCLERAWNLLNMAKFTHLKETGDDDYARSKGIFWTLIPRIVP